MAGDLNQVTLIGRLGKDPEVRTMNSGDKVANFSIATSETWKKDGEKKEKTEWHNVVVWGKLAEIVEQYVSKGDKIMVQGKLQTRKWEKDGVDRYTTEIVLTGFDAKLLMLQGRREDANGDERDGYGQSVNRDGSGGGNQSRHTRPSESFSAGHDDEDMIPF